MAKQERGTRSRRALLEAAAEVFDLRGFDAAGTNEILARSGLTRGALYHHFPSKESIAVALFAEHSGALVAPERSTRMQSVIDLTFGYAHQLQRDPVLRAIVRLAMEKTSFPRQADTPYDQSSAAIRRLLDEARAQGEILPGLDLADATSVIVGGFAGMQVMSQVYTDRADLPERVTAMWRLLLPGMVAPGMIGHLVITPRNDAAQAVLDASSSARREASGGGAVALAFGKRGVDAGVGGQEGVHPGDAEQAAQPAGDGRQGEGAVGVLGAAPDADEGAQS
ncbi:ScbR family autoregulator-binding transcription factor [Streptomyces sp. Edi4]|uniref:ScbR family autoregulator-binding transcription factor n=1 Tax=Streptomyces sp. Edi4 TaxID=3162527 RepID=UPI003305EFC2